MAHSEDWLTWCRLCAKIQTKPYIEIFFKNEEKHDLVKILEQYYCLEVSEDDKLPKTVCQNCYSGIQNHLDFVKSITKTQEMYSDLVNCGYENASELFDIRQRYKIDTFDVAEQSDIKVGFVDLHPMVDCTVIIQDQNVKNPLDEQSLSNDEAIFNNDHLIDHKTSEKDYQILSEDEIKIDETEEFLPEKEEKEDKSVEKEIKPERRRECQKKLDVNYQEDNDSEDEDDYVDIDDSIDDDAEDGGEETEDGDFEQDNDYTSSKKRKVRKDKLMKKLDCSECPYKSWRSNDLKWHMISKHGRPVDDDHKFVCNQCSKVFRNQHFLNRHLETHLPEDQRRTWPCPHCDKFFSSSNNAKIHIKHIHFNDKKFICEECGFIAKTNGSLKQHMETHLPVGKYECTQCGQRIRSRYRLKVHMDTHNPDKFPCKICNLKFSSRMTLKNHLVIHSDAMPYKCDSCGRAFKLSKYLKSHLLTHTGLKHYSCKFCDRQFAHSANYRLHMKKEHPEQLAKLDAEGGPKKATGNVPTLQALKAFAKTVPNGTS